MRENVLSNQYRRIVMYRLWYGIFALPLAMYPNCEASTAEILFQRMAVLTSLLERFVCPTRSLSVVFIYDVFLFHHSHETVLGFLNNCVPEKCRIWTVNNRTFHSPMMWHVRDIMWIISSWDAMKIHNMYLHVHWFFGMFQIFWTTKWMRGMLSLTSLYCKKYAKRRTFASSCTNYNILVNTTQQPILHIYIYRQ